MIELVPLLAILLALIFARIDIAFAIGTVSYLWLFIAGESMTTGVTRIFSGLNSFVLLAIPFFLLAGELMNNSEITDRIVRFANYTIGRIRGGLAQANVLASLFFAGITGAAVADVAALGSVFIPSMTEEGYDQDFSSAITAASSIVGPIIPPSIIIVIYGSVTSTSIGALFAAAVVPGLMLGAALMVITGVLSVRQNYPSHSPDVPRGEVPSLIFDSLVALTMPAIILGGILGGVFTPTEAAAIACVYALLIGGVFYRTLGRDDIRESLSVTLERSTQLYAIIGFASILSWMLAKEGITRELAAALIEMGLGPIAFMLVIGLVLLFVGTWLEIGAAAIILAPTLASIAQTLGIPAYQFGIMFIVTLNFGLITPPLGICLFAASSVSERPVWEISKKIVPFYVADIAVLLAIIYFPELTLAFPRLAGF
ncbi:TRAP transporter large permease [Haloarcula nitratireducens]|uniref:TRAP transporter large permease n=1 Tax=Haloarcula nitratireducens TaxID=2487749 RepID=A0AAW4PHJ1_9EURY|nr:TRAP transporter large permease [Halomicroarcula nitratireducens]MBX0297048.1 TRAP transporter large permease [Halomicroarcula nitratireducens]